ncbi:MAG: nucleotidyl transferase AbiEii/AbiGii toxin family protein [Planctomycetes bacterium]|nr:nucleotidyl transferase AbiEii/AbiGii toxin family protein [Planctomycetota bacterium]
MAVLIPIRQVEAFHLAFLRVLESRLDRARFVVKGGVNLRAWFGSLRYSEDLDIDLLRGEVFELRDKVDAVLGAPALTSLLRTLGLALVHTTRPKQTETTPRWKLELHAARGLPLHTKIEFSRRGSEDEFALEPVLAEVVLPYGIPAPTVNHYTAASALRQKLGALAGRRETQARDVWDLEHLFRTTKADPRPLPAKTTAALPTAIDRVLQMPYQVFKAQVIPYLASDHQELYGSQESWQRIQELVFDRLMELQG